MAKTSGYYPETASPLLSPPNTNPYSSVPPPPLQSYYTGIPTSPPDTFILLPVRLCLRRRRTLRFRSLLSSSCLLTIFLLTLLLLSFFFLYPSDPDLSVARLHLSRIRVTTSTSVALTISMGIDLKIRNPDFFSIDYSYLNSTVLYRGRTLGSVTSEGGHVRARGVSYVQADLNLDAVRIIDDVFYLIEDIASGIIPFETKTQIVGDVHLFFLNVPVQVNVLNV
ncbi:Late embryogenesis abundant protein [Carex littledalei]|uniref:Late embryogenesis abundant protein n=1 Tax=Carex littledalei TaxID=544730 RepID=A0A833QJX5_9POAL|nr:Late embryogenesis abundant protein [Carex littledalei]